MTVNRDLILDIQRFLVAVDGQRRHPAFVRFFQTLPSLHLQGLQSRRGEALIRLQAAASRSFGVSLPSRNIFGLT